MTLNFFCKKPAIGYRQKGSTRLNFL